MSNLFKCIFVYKLSNFKLDINNETMIYISKDMKIWVTNNPEKHLTNINPNYHISNLIGNGQNKEAITSREIEFLPIIADDKLGVKSAYIVFEYIIEIESYEPEYVTNAGINSITINDKRAKLISDEKLQKTEIILALIMSSSNNESHKNVELVGSINFFELKQKEKIIALQMIISGSPLSIENFDVENIKKTIVDINIEEIPIELKPIFSLILNSSDIRLNLFQRSFFACVALETMIKFIYDKLRNSKKYKSTSDNKYPSLSQQLKQIFTSYKNKNIKDDIHNFNELNRFRNSLIHDAAEPDYYRLGKLQSMCLRIISMYLESI